MIFNFISQPNPITETLVKEGGKAITEITLLNPILSLLLIVLFGIVIGLSFVTWKLSKKVTKLSEDLYKEAKSDFQLILAFEKKLDSLIEKNELTREDVQSIRETITSVKTLLELIYKQ